MAPKPDTITKITVRGFKSICDRQEVEIRPLTLLAGANSSGKSSLMQPLLLLKQTLEAPSDPGALLLDGPNVRFTKAEQMFSRGEPVYGRGEPVTDFSVRMELSYGQSLELTFKWEKEVGFNVASMEFPVSMMFPRWMNLAGWKKIAEKGLHVHLDREMSSEDIQKNLPSRVVQSYNRVLRNEETETPTWSVRRDRCFLALELSGTADRHGHALSVYSGWDFVPHLKGLIHLPGLRGNPERTYPKYSTGPMFPGNFADYVASVITEWQKQGDPRVKELGKALEDMGLTWKVEAKHVDDTQVELRVGRLTHSKRGGAHDLVSIADVGFGVSQCLPVVVALIAAQPGQLVYLEQPEIHLHPLAQRKLAHVIKRATEKGIVAIVETHSALLLKEIQTLVAKGELDKDIVKLHWFQRQEDGRTKITSADLDENGAFGPWPEDFDEVELDAEKDYLDAVESREFHS